MLERLGDSSPGGSGAPEDAGKVVRVIRTVRGDIPPERLGVTLSHEHLHCDISVHSGKIDNVLTDDDAMIRELASFRAAGGEAILEMTPLELGRDPVSLRRISEASGVTIVCGVSFYVNDTYPSWVREASSETIAGWFLRELSEGTGGVGAGFIGEVGSHNSEGDDPSRYGMFESERKVFRAAALAHARTGVAIFTHASLGRGGHAQLALLEECGADPRKIVIGHCDAMGHEDLSADLAYFLPILQRGSCCSFDLVGWSELMSDAMRAERIAALVDRGYADRIVLSMDTCRRSQLRQNGGRGYDYLLCGFIPMLRSAGAGEREIRMMLVDNPARLLSV